MNFRRTEKGTEKNERKRKLEKKKEKSVTKQQKERKRKKEIIRKEINTWCEFLTKKNEV